MSVVAVVVVVVVVVVCVCVCVCVCVYVAQRVRECIWRMETSGTLQSCKFKSQKWQPMA